MVSARVDAAARRPSPADLGAARALPTGHLHAAALVTGPTGKRTVYGTATPAHPHLPRAPIVRLLGIDAAFLQRATAPGDAMTMFVAADAHALTVQLFQSGPEPSRPTRTM